MITDNKNLYQLLDDEIQQLLNQYAFFTNGFDAIKSKESARRFYCKVEKTTFLLSLYSDLLLTKKRAI